jgi:hypothetical protein
MPLSIARILMFGSDTPESGEQRHRMLRSLRPLDDRVFTELAQARAELEFTYRNNLDLR